MSQPGTAITWHFVVWRARAAILIFLLAALAMIVPSQVVDLLADMADIQPGSWLQAIAFQLSMILLAFFLWFWSRAVLLATFRIPDTREGRNLLAARVQFGPDIATVFDWLPRLLFFGIALTAAIAAVRSSKYVGAAIAVAWGIALCWLLTYRLQLQASLGLATKGDIGPVRPRAPTIFMRLLRRLLDLLDGAPLGRAFGGLVLAIASAMFVISALLSFVPGGIGFSTFLTRWFPSASMALLLFGLSVGPLTALTYVLDRIETRLRLFGFEFQLRYVPVLLILVIVITFGPVLMNLHAVRIVNAPAPMTPDQRVSMAEYFRLWVKDCATPDNQPVRPVLVAVSGGASRAGLWAARVLTLVDGDLGNASNTSIFSVSSVSGGSFGTAAYMAMRAKQLGVGRNGCRLFPGTVHEGPLRAALRADAIGPALAGALLGDIPRAFVGAFAAPVVWLHNRSAERSRPQGEDWVFRGNDRAEALEHAFETNWKIYGLAGGIDGLGLDRPYLSLFYDPANADMPRHFVPAWIANGTDQQKGDRIITAPFSINLEEACPKFAGDTESRDLCRRNRAAYPWGGPFPSALDALGLLKADVPISTAIDNTSRFPFLSPSGELTSTKPIQRRNAAQIIDGGYFENEGLQTTLEVARWLIKNGPALSGGRAVYPLIVEATADADFVAEKAGDPPLPVANDPERHIIRCANVKPPNPDLPIAEPRSAQLLVPLLGLSAVRGGHSHVALIEARQEFCNEVGHQAFFHFYLYNSPDFAVPLNWSLSEEVAQFIWSGAPGACWNRMEELSLRETLASPLSSWTPGNALNHVNRCRKGMPMRVAIRPPPESMGVPAD